jgi:predicted DNA binding protein
MAEQQRAIVEDTDTEIVFEIESESESLTQLSKSADCTVTIESLMTCSDGRLRQFVTVEGIDREEFLSAVDGSRIQQPAVMVERNNCFVAAFTTDRNPVVDCLTEQRATLTKFRAADGVGTVTIRVPNTVDIRRLAEQFESTFSRAELRAKRQLDSTIDTPEGFREQLEETLTDRQHETLQAAYHAGFFAWPRANTGETIADRLGITGPTFLQHLRAGERKLLEVLFEQDQAVFSD